MANANQIEEAGEWRMAYPQDERMNQILHIMPARDPTKWEGKRIPHYNCDEEEDYDDDDDDDDDDDGDDDDDDDDALPVVVAVRQSPGICRVIIYTSYMYIGWYVCMYVCMYVCIVL